MSTLSKLIKRNIKLFFKDKGMFFTALITPVILLVLYASFLGNVFRDSLVGNIPNADAIPKRIVDGVVAGQLASSILAVACITVAFCTNFVMVQDKASGIINDFLVSPVKSATLALGYYTAALISTLIVLYTATAVLLAYIGFVGWYLSAVDVLLLLFDVLLLSLFGTALSSLVGFFLRSQGQSSAVGAIVSAGYGFICGAYMPLSSFSPGLRNALMCLPGTYGTGLVRNHLMRGAIEEFGKTGAAPDIRSVRDALDCNLYFRGSGINTKEMYAVMIVSVILLIGAYVLLNVIKNRRTKR